MTSLSWVTRHASIEAQAYILACDRTGDLASGGHGTANTHGDHGRGSSSASATSAWSLLLPGSSACLRPPSGASRPNRRPTPRRRSQQASPRPGTRRTASNVGGCGLPGAAEPKHPLSRPVYWTLRSRVRPACLPEVLGVVPAMIVMSM